jgi:anti-sigma factor RsiW
MKCSNIHDDLIFYLDRELSDERMEAVRKHLDECADCRSFMELLNRQMQLIDDEKHPEVSPYFFTRLSARMDMTPEFKVQRSSWRSIVQPAFFTVLLLAGISGGLYIGNRAYTPEKNTNTSVNLLMIDDFSAEPIETFLLDEL